jgi:hypothetical protein
MSVGVGIGWRLRLGSLSPSRAMFVVGYAVLMVLRQTASIQAVRRLRSS